MAMKKYSIQEIERMREALFRMKMCFVGNGTEDELRTFMENGTDAEELERRAKEVQDDYRRSSLP